MDTIIIVSQAPSPSVPESVRQQGRNWHRPSPFYCKECRLPWLQRAFPSTTLDKDVVHVLVTGLTLAHWITICQLFSLLDL